MSKPKKKTAITKLQEIMQYYTVDLFTGGGAMENALAYYNRSESTDKWVQQGIKEAKIAVSKDWVLIIVRPKPEYADKADFVEVRQWCLSLHIHVLNFYKNYISNFN